MRRFILVGGSAGGAPPAFTPTLSISSGGLGPFRVGAPWGPLFTGSPLPSDAGVTVYNVLDNQGGGPTSRLGSGAGFAGPSATYTLAAPGTVSVHASVTQNGSSANTGNVSATFGNDVWSGVGTAGATGLNGTTGALTGATGTLTGALSVTGILNFSPTPTAQKVYYASDQFYGTRTFKDASGFPFSMNPPTTISVVNSASQSRPYYLYESVNLLDSVQNPISVT